MRLLFPAEQLQLEVSMRGRLLLLCVILLVAVFGLPGSFIAGHAAAGTGGASLSQVVQSWVGTASPTARLDAIVTFDSKASVSRIDALNVGATKLTALPMAFASLTAAQIRTVASWPGVVSIWHDQQNKPVLDESVPLIGADKVRAGTGLKRPYTGAGVNVAVIDTGVDGTHPDLPYGTKVDQLVVAGHPFDREPFTFTPAPTGDTYGHGTHVSSIIGGLGTASGGRFTGVAPGAHIQMFKTDVGPFLLDSYTLAAFDWILSHPEANIRVSSNSWGCCAGVDYSAGDPVSVATKALYDKNVTVVFSAGNDGGPNTLSPYCESPWVMCAASGTKDMKLSSFSSRGRLAGPWDRRAAQKSNTGIYRPGITAPGENIEAAKSSMGTLVADGTDPENPLYTTLSGTSMAAPHIAGTIALMLEARSKLSAQNIIDILENTTTNMPSYELWETGIGYLNAYAAVVAAEKGKVNFPPIVNGKTPQFTLSSSAPYSGLALTDTWQLASCPDTTPGQILQHHQFTIGAGVDVVYTEVSWGDETQLLYLRLYDPNCNVAGESAALLDIGNVSHRALAVTAPAAGTWTVGVYGRVNVPTNYTGVFQTYDKN
jgi:serine protease AprX